MERISTLMDGELGAREATEELKRIKQDPELRSAWETYHLIGDALRGQSAVSPGFAARVASRLEQEPAVLAPRRRFEHPVVMRVALPIAASVCGVAVVAWLALNNPFQTVAPVQVAATEQPSVQVAQGTPEAGVPAVPTAVAVHDYLLAHQQFSPRTAIQGVASYMRTVSDEGDGSN
jgi:sigma-E factor negative regulatory protein RseA